MPAPGGVKTVLEHRGVMAIGRGAPLIYIKNENRGAGSMVLRGSAVGVAHQEQKPSFSTRALWACCSASILAFTSAILAGMKPSTCVP